MVRLTDYNWPLNNTGSTYSWIFFNKYTVGHSYPCISHPRVQPTADGKQYFWSAVGTLWMQSVNCMNCFTLFYNNDLSIRGFWDPRGPGTSASQMFRDSWGFWGQSKVIWGFSTTWGLVFLTPHIVQGPTV